MQWNIPETNDGPRITANSITVHYTTNKVCLVLNITYLTTSML